MIDAHIHADTRPYEDFGNMAIAGVKAAITCAHDPLRMSTSDVVLDHFHRILNNDVNRAEENGLKLYVALGIHPRSIAKDYERVMEKLPFLLKDKGIVAIGEIGLETASKSEKNVFKRQLLLAETLNMVAIIHTPRRNKEKITTITTQIIEENVDPHSVLIDHVDGSIIDNLMDLGTMMGLTIQPNKMTPDEAVSILMEYGDEYGLERFVLNSDMSSSPSDPLSVPKTVHKMRLSGFEDEDINRISYTNASNFFGI
jgi:predicted metal-dependent TIM-barrel fold hydrolase